jgi:hypothetical protein
MQCTKKAQFGRLLEGSCYKAERKRFRTTWCINISPADLNNAFITHIGDEFVLGVRRTPSAHVEDAPVPL